MSVSRTAVDDKVMLTCAVTGSSTTREQTSSLGEAQGDSSGSVRAKQHGAGREGGADPGAPRLHDGEPAGGTFDAWAQPMMPVSFDRGPDAEEHNHKGQGLMTSPNSIEDQPGLVHEKLRPSTVLIDPKALTRGPIGELLAKAFPECTLVTASACEELFETEGVARPNLVVVYIRGAGLTNTWAQRTLELLRAQLPEASVVVLSDKDDVEEVNRALTHGVRGYIPTSVDCEIAVAALRFISAGGTFVPADTLCSTAAKPHDHPEDRRQRRSDGLDLTPRELSVLDLLREGKPNKVIARELDMQESTVKVHVRNILRKLNASNRTHAALLANRLLSQDPEPVASAARFG